MIEYRVTKYPPALRDAGGSYTRSEWTSFSDIGSMFNGSQLSEAEYLQVENAYINSALEFLRESGVSSLVIRMLENHRGAVLTVSEGSNISLEQVKNTLSRVLREEFWCKFEGPSSFIHVGYDYYMYVGVPAPCAKAEQLASSLGLFVEPFQSPYRDRGAV
jgi:hypothetical protein